MRVLFVDNAGLLSAGAYHSLVALILQLRKMGIESFVALPDRADGIVLLENNKIPYVPMRSCAYSQMCSVKGNNIEYLKMCVKYFIVRKDAYKLAKYIKQNRIEIVHDNTSVSYIGYYAAKIAKVHHIWHIREFLEEDFEKKFWNKKLAFNQFNQTDAIIFVSNVLYEKYKNQLINENMYCIYNGIDSEKFYNPTKKIFQKDCIEILSVGRVCEAKGQELLIYAAGIIRNKGYKNFLIRIVGLYEKSYYQYLVDLCKKIGVEDCIVFMGQNNDIKSVYNEADILCMTSKCEAFGRVTVEAMMGGLLVIGANSGGTKEIISDKENGILFEACNKEDLAEKLIYCLNNKQEVCRYAETGRKYARSCLDAKNNAANIKEVYEKVSFMR